jgi:hypothetical protein
MATAILVAAVVAATALTIKFAVSEGLLGRGKVGGGIEVRRSERPREVWVKFQR